MASVNDSDLKNIALNKEFFSNKNIIIIKTEWNKAIVDELESKCIATLQENGLNNYKTYTVSGAFEIPFAAKNIYQKTSIKPDCIIAFGCVIKGDTPHFDYVCKAVTDGVLQLNLTLPVPTIFGVLTVNNKKQAQQRIGGKHGHKGEEAALTALKMIALMNTL